MKEGDLVKVRRHKCSTDKIGPFISLVNDYGLDDDTGLIIVGVTDPRTGLDWGVEERFCKVILSPYNNSGIVRR